MCLLSLSKDKLSKQQIHLSTYGTLCVPTFDATMYHMTDHDHNP